MSLFLVLTISATFFIAIAGRMIPPNTLLTAVVKPENRGGFMSLNSSVMQPASGLASVIAGGIVVQPGAEQPVENYNFAGYVAVSFTIAALLLARKLEEVTSD